MSAVTLARSLFNVSAGILAKASLVGAKSVNGPPARVVARLAFSTAKMQYRYILYIYIYTNQFQSCKSYSKVCCYWANVLCILVYGLHTQCWNIQFRNDLYIKKSRLFTRFKLLYTNLDQTLMSSLHGLMNCEIDGLKCRVITSEYRPRVHWIHMLHLFCMLFIRKYLINVLVLLYQNRYALMIIKQLTSK